MSEKYCAVCKLPSERCCSACGKVAYCSSKHQKEDWHQHKSNCVLYKIYENEKLGRHLIATRNIPEGTIILIEEPILIGPKLYSLPICLGCYTRVDGTYFCTKCGFPMCSIQCENMTIHRDNECKIFEKKNSLAKKIENYDTVHPLYQSILPLRCLLLSTTFPDKWNLLCKMENHLEMRKHSSEVWNENQINIVNYLLDWHGLKSMYTEETINRVIGIIEVNSFQIITVNKIEICGLFKIGAMMSHDCRPNTHHAFTEAGNLILRSSIKIQKNSVITMSYVDVLSGTLERRHLLEQSKYFCCDCLRCQDSTEFGTFISGIKCHNCLNGFLVPENSIDSLSKWICFNKFKCTRNLNCNYSMSLSEIETKLKEIEPKIKALFYEIRSDILENQLKYFENSFLHLNHYLLLPLWKRLNKLYEIEESQMTQSSLQFYQKNQEIIMKLLSVLNVLDPGLTRERGVLLHRLYKVNKEIIETEIKEKKSQAYIEAMEKNQLLKLELEKLFELDNLIGVKHL